MFFWQHCFGPMCVRKAFLLRDPVVVRLAGPGRRSSCGTPRSSFLLRDLVGRPRAGAQEAHGDELSRTTEAVVVSAARPHELEVVAVEVEVPTQLAGVGSPPKRP